MQDSFDLRALRDIGLSHDTIQAALAQPRPDGARLARVVDIRRDRLIVHDGTQARPALPWPTLRVSLDLVHEPLVVGDWVWWRAAAVDPDPGWVIARIAPRNRLTRRDPAGGRQGLVANVDTALLVMGLDHDFNLRRLDRFLVLAHSAGVRAVIVLTKADRCPDPAAAVERVRTHLGATPALPALADASRSDSDEVAGAGARAGEGDGHDPGNAAVAAVVAIDARSAAAGQALAPWLARGSTLVMLGSSGAGKTTLTNTLADAVAPTHAVRATDERGQHTTTARTLHRTLGGTCLIDTPGMRQLWLDTDADALTGAFPEIDRLASRCRYRDCAHRDEPGCAVRENVPAARLASFQKLLREANRDPDDVFQRRLQRSRWKQRSRDNRARAAARETGQTSR